MEVRCYKNYKSIEKGAVAENATAPFCLEKIVFDKQNAIEACLHVWFKF